MSIVRKMKFGGRAFFLGNEQAMFVFNIDMIQPAIVLTTGDERCYFAPLNLVGSPVGKVRLGIERPLGTNAAIQVRARSSLWLVMGLLRVDVHPRPGTRRSSMAVRRQRNTFGHRIERSPQGHRYIHRAGVSKSHGEREGCGEARSFQNLLPSSLTNERRAPVAFFP
jgi:hypothetical protein